MQSSSPLWAEVGTNDEWPKGRWSWVGGTASGDAVRSSAQEPGLGVLSCP